MKRNWVIPALVAGTLVSTTGCGGGGTPASTPTPPPSSSAPSPPPAPAPAPAPAPPPASSPPPDTTPPDTTLGGAPAATTKSRSASFTLGTTEAGSTFEVSIDGGAWAAATSPHSLANLADGPHTFAVRSIDAANNIDASPATAAWTVDGTPPVVAISFPGTVAYTDASNITLRGTAQDAGTITALTVNGAAATSTDAFRHWTANVAVDTGTNAYTVAATDILGNTNATAAAASVDNRGPVLSFVTAIAVDAAKNHVLVLDNQRSEILALDPATGVATVFSGPSRGTGPTLISMNGLVVDSVHDRLLTYNAGQFFAIDRDTGDRTAISSVAPAGYETYSSFTYDAATNTAYSCGYPPNVFATHLDTDTRQVLSNNSFGSGPTFVQPVAAMLDTSAAGGGHRLLVNDVGANPGVSASRLFAVDLTTAARTVLSTSAAPAVGAGPTLYGMGSLTLDAANNRVLVTAYARSEPARLMSIDLTNGDRTTLGISDSITAIAVAAVAPSSPYIYVSVNERSRVLRFDRGTGQFARFADSNVGSGAVVGGFNGLDFDRSTGGRSLVIGAQISPFGGEAGAIRVDLDTSSRTLLTAGGVGSGPTIGIAMSAQRDTRSGVTDRLLIYDSGTFPDRLVGVDLATGNRSVLSSPSLGFYSSENMTLDTAQGRMLAAARGNTIDPFTLIGLDIATGANTAISGPARGTGPAFSDNGYSVADIAIDDVPGGQRRYLVASSDPTLTSVDPASGNRSRLVLTGNTPLPISGMDLDVAGRRAYLVADQWLGVVDLATGAAQQVDTGSGPVLRGVANKVRVDAERGVAYVTTSDGMLLAVDLASGQRAIVSR
ncbi:MAG TPA: hypothetical protein VMF52_18165 [Steroidobacteraceae bacterium]|nr:hypothetical protein [Steroidobacteraceae bacterium]